MTDRAIIALSAWAFAVLFDNVLTITLFLHIYVLYCQVTPLRNSAVAESEHRKHHPQRAT